MSIFMLQLKNYMKQKKMLHFLITSSSYFFVPTNPKNVSIPLGMKIGGAIGSKKKYLDITFFSLLKNV